MSYRAAHALNDWYYNEVVGHKIPCTFIFLSMRKCVQYIVMNWCIVGTFQQFCWNTTIPIFVCQGRTTQHFILTMILRYFSFVPDLHWEFPWPQTNILRWSLSSVLLHSSILLFHFFSLYSCQVPSRHDSDFQRKLSPCKLYPFL